MRVESMRRLIASCLALAALEFLPFESFAQASPGQCPLFKTAVDYAAAAAGTGLSGPIGLAIGDFNGDHKKDLAVANDSLTSHTVSILLGNGDGTFQPVYSFFAGQSPFELAVGDFNGDHKDDLVVTNFSDGAGGRPAPTISVLLGNGDGTFQAPVAYGTGSNPDAVSVGDFNADGKADLAVANFSADSISILLGNGDGTFQTAVGYGVGSTPVDVALGDFNGDHHVDLAASNQESDNVSILLGNGDGTFQAAVNYAAGSIPQYLEVGDFDGDHKPDLAVADFGTNSVSILLGNGNGTFQAAVSYGAGSSAEGIAVSDLNGDGKVDLAVTNYYSNDLSVLLGNGDGTFQTADNYAVGPNPIDVVVSDFDADGRPDLAVGNQSLDTAGTGTISVLLSKTCNAPPVARCVNVTVPAGPTCSASASIDNGSSDPDSGDTLTLAQAPAGPYALGSTSVTLTVTDNHGASSQCTASVTVLDETPPTIVCPGPISTNADPGVCGASVAFGAAVFDNCAASVVYDIGGSPIASPQAFPIGTTTVHAVALDGAANATACTFGVSVANPNPVVTLTGPPSGSLYPVNTAIGFTAIFTDAGGGTHTGTWMFDAISSPAAIVEPSGSTPGSASTTYTFTTPGVYLAKLTISDGCGGSGTADQVNGMQQLVVVYDPSAGFVTGGGWIDSPAGAYRAIPTLTGSASFGFVSKYKKGASVPTGETEFQFRVADFDFHGSIYQWLVISGSMAQYKGTGTVNGSGIYAFLLTATDGDISGGGGIDKFRIKITDANGAVVYDNVYGGSDDLNSANPQALAGGSIVIHK